MNTYLLPQHGAWAFLGAPDPRGRRRVMDAAAPDSGGRILAAAWVTAYPLSYAALGLIRARHLQRFRRPFTAWLVWVGLGYLVRSRSTGPMPGARMKRAIGNDLAFVFSDGWAADVWTS
jgi:hypothetical protein